MVREKSGNFALLKWWTPCWGLKGPIFSSPGRSPGRAIVLPPALAAASALAKC